MADKHSASCWSTSNSQDSAFKFPLPKNNPLLANTLLHNQEPLQQET
jgi:hypothetical protein